MFREFQEIFSWLRCNVATMILPRGRKKKKKNVKKKEEFLIVSTLYRKTIYWQVFPDE